MRSILLALPLVLALMSVSACTLPVTTATPTSGAQVPTAAQTATIQGRVMVPASIIAAGGGNIISTGGGNIIATGGLNYRALAVAEQPLANTEVFLADEAGQPLPGVRSVKTDAEGRYELPGVPAGRTVVVAAKLQTPEKKVATLQTIVKTSDLGATADVSAATTMVSTAVTQKGEALAKFNPATFRTAVEATGKHLKDGELPDFADRAAVTKKMNELATAIQEIKDALAEIKQELAAIKKDVAEIKELLKKKQAESTSGETPTQPGSDDNPCEGSFRWLDQNQDGAVSYEEWLGLRPDFDSDEELNEAFEILDTNYDATISLRELTAAWCGLEASSDSSEDVAYSEDEAYSEDDGTSESDGDLGVEAGVSVGDTSLDVSL